MARRPRQHTHCSQPGHRARTTALNSAKPGATPDPKLQIGREIHQRRRKARGQTDDRLLVQMQVPTGHPGATAKDCGPTEWQRRTR